jgi:hypothetical protein
MIFVAVLGTITGICVMGAVYGITALFFPALYKFRVIFETIITATAVFFAWRKGEFSLFRQTGLSNVVKHLSSFEWFIFLYLICWIVVFVWTLYSYPNGEIDAWSMWIVKARTLAITGGNVGITLLNGYYHSDYPLLLPYINARFAQAFGAFSSIIPRVTVFLFYCSFTGMFVSFIALVKNRLTACIALIVILLTPCFQEIFQGLFADGYVFTLVTALCISIIYGEINANKTNKISYFLCGIAIGALVMMKNEGLLLVASVFIGYLLFRLWSKQVRRVPIEILKILAGAAPFLLLFFAAKIQYPIENDVVSGSVFDRYTQLFELGRYAMIVKGFVAVVVSFVWMCIPIFLLCLPFVFGFSAHRKKAVFLIFIPLCIAFMGYFGIYLITPHDLDWHLRSSADRVLGHLLPSYYLFVFIITKPIAPKQR